MTEPDRDTDQLTVIAYEGGHTLAMIAAALGVTKQRVHQRLQRATGSQRPARWKKGWDE